MAISYIRISAQPLQPAAPRHWKKYALLFWIWQNPFANTYALAPVRADTEVTGTVVARTTRAPMALTLTPSSELAEVEETSL